MLIVNTYPYRFLGYVECPIFDRCYTHLLVSIAFRFVMIAFRLCFFECCCYFCKLSITDLLFFDVSYTENSISLKKKDFFFLRNFNMVNWNFFKFKLQDNFSSLLLARLIIQQTARKKINRHKILATHQHNPVQTVKLHQSHLITAHKIVCINKVWKRSEKNHFGESTRW